ncbi:uncharacterized protein LOC131942545 [Physella acuta]|uniref:uncharacterized protein LOC131942545 n=1 Tax=Physella acuta TaxID=109671 RepID=UPI0027DE9F02|nr:uncharacterized protein LOC131942545 [Physella acuta]
MAGNKHKMEFVPMSKIMKTTTFRDLRCSDWVATEKIHGASFQFFTNDGINIHMASRRRVLDGEKSFQKCDLVEFHSRYHGHVNRLFSLIGEDSRWTVYTDRSRRSCDADDDRDNDGGNLIGEGAKCCELKIIGKVIDGNNGIVDYVTTDHRLGTDVISSEHDISTNETHDDIELRVYGELYGGGGVHENVSSALQKEIIYSDEFRFYVFAISINRKWLNVTELNDLCKQAGFPYYATPVCEPKATVKELVCWLTESGFMTSKSRFTDKDGDANTRHKKTGTQLESTGDKRKEAD